MVILYMRYGIVRKLISKILGYFVVVLMYMFQRRMGVRWTREHKSVSLLDIKMVWKVISIGNHKLRR